MSHGTPFIDPETGTLDTAQILTETYRLVRLIVLFGGLALVPFVLSLLLDGTPTVVLFTIVTQFVLATGTGIVLIYVVARGMQLADR